MGVETQCGGVLCTELHESLAAKCPLLADPLHAAGGILHADNPRPACHLGHGFRQYVDHTPARNIVEDDRDRAVVVENLVVAEQACLVGLVVIGRHDQRRICANGFSVLKHVEGLCRCVGASAGNNRNAAGHEIDDPLDDVLMLDLGDSRAFARCPDSNQPVAALGNVPLNEAFQRFDVNASVPERCDKGGNGSLEFEHVASSRIRAV